MVINRFACKRDEPVVQTNAGKIRGFLVNDVYTFHGIKYANAKRFHMPEPVEPWEGVKDALSYGYVCPLMEQDKPSNEVMIPHRYWPMDEHCQYLNIWTPSLDCNTKKPVMVWIHGGGFSAGSSIEQVAYEGDNMSKYGDVVVVSLNHRLNILGYLDLSPFGEQYTNSGNAGQADLVAALQWIRDNITAFGGDPDNVTLFGQSGGGFKIWMLMQTPSADGLFHKAIIQSGLVDGFGDMPDGDGTRVVNALLKKLGFQEDETDKLENVPYARMVEAYISIAPTLIQEGAYIGGSPTPGPNTFYAGDPRKYGFTDHAKTIPVMIGTAFGEFAFSPGPDKAHMTEDDIRSLIEEKYGTVSSRLIDLFNKAYPDKELDELLALDSLFRAPTKDFIKKKSVHEEAPTFSYMFSLQFPFDGGKSAWHCSEIPFVFHNIDRVPVCYLQGISEQLEENIFLSWMNFAKCGNPNHKGLPQWLPSKPDDEETMIFDKVCETRINYDNELIALHKQIMPGFGAVKNEPIQH